VQVSVDAIQPRHEKALQSFYETFPFAEEAVFVSLDTFAALDAGLLISAT
jgi:hypothetical protein